MYKATFFLLIIGGFFSWNEVENTFFVAVFAMLKAKAFIIFLIFLVTMHKNTDKPSIAVILFLLDTRLICQSLFVVNRNLKFLNDFSFCS